MLLNHGKNWRHVTTKAALALSIVLLSWLGGASIKSAGAGYTPLSTFLGQYSYSDSSCSTKTDPITIVFTFGNGFYDHPHDHFKISDHGDWDGDGGGGQYFLDDLGCSSTDDRAATSSTYNDGWHARWETAWTTLTEQSYAATPHWDDWDWTEWTHCVRPDGFVDGRDEVVSNFGAASDGHSIVSNYWGNTDAILKCNGQYASNSGTVYYIDLR